MNIIVVGCGKIGTTILESLVDEGHDVTAVDSDPAVLADVTSIHDVMGVTGNGADCELLREAGVAKADLLVAATGSDEVNMLSCFIAGGWAPSTPLPVSASRSITIRACIS